MEQLREALFALKMDVLRKRQLLAQLESLREQEQALQQRVSLLAEQMAAEQQNVERLEGCSLARLFHYMSGKYEQRLDQEKQEAYEAAVRHKTACQELEKVQAVIAADERELAGLEDCEQRYEALLEQRVQQIKATDQIHGVELLRLEEALQELENQQRELAEAAQAGRDAQQAADAILQELDDAASMGVWDLLGGGLLVTMAKHDHLDAAQNLVEQLQIKLRNFKTELADVSIDVNLQMQVDGFLYFADYFFDGIFADLAVQNHIEEQQRQIQRLKQQIDEVLGTLQTMGTDLEQRKQQLQQSRNRLALQY